MDKEYKELLVQLYKQVESTYKEIVLPFYHFFGKDKVDLQYNKDVEDEYDCILNYNYIDSMFPRSLLSESTGYNKAFCDLEEEKKKEIIHILEEIVTGNKEKAYTHTQIISELKMDKADILIYFPTVRITNENDKYIDIQDLYVKVTITYEGKLKNIFTLNRTTYTSSQLQSNYLHSHVAAIGNTLRELRQFKTPCLGHGPIKGTCDQLMTHKCSDLEWQLFCVELDRYVHVESREGVPYKYLENIGSRRRTDINNMDIIYTNFCYTTRLFNTQLIRDYAEYIIDSRKLKFNYINGSYSLGMPMLEYVIMASNLFIEWYNKRLKEQKSVPKKEDMFARNLLQRVVMANGKLYNEPDFNSLETYKIFIGETILTFKGKNIPFEVINNEKDNKQNGLIILNPRITISTLNIIIQVLNYRYGKEKAKSGPADITNWEASTTTIKTDVEYI